MILVSIIIPCYNSSPFLTDAIQSVEKYPDKTVYELIVVNDGSTDQSTIELLESLTRHGYRVIHQANKGPAAARNAGCKMAIGEYILFLDSDNKLRSDYITKGVEVLKRDASVGIVYGNPVFFGEQEAPRFTSGPFELRKMFMGNYIDMCSMIRKSLWEDLGGLDESRDLIGHEDWEFWLRAGLANVKFHHIDEFLFEYRLNANSLVKQAIDPERYRRMLNYVYTKHLTGLLTCYRSLYNRYEFYRTDMKRPLRTFLKSCYHKYFSGAQG